ncbi:SAC3/GANP/Nin1/mts3/eIF-3 p25 family-domain-containing protein [Limtongia smithiae]|uniref:SAC3/GANP/Nin1/mts3/eIF-3 p25 family-domain-containing protein n=1 Tax=Limtongia smithiae TaxID=1125753 RepID=UPI0034CEAEBD
MRAALTNAGKPTASFSVVQAGKALPHKAAPAKTAKPGSSAFSAGTSSNSTAATPVNASTWPAPLKQYVERCFAAASPSQRGQVESQLKKMINEVLDAGTLWTTKWDALPVPLAAATATENEEDGMERLRKDVKASALGESTRAASSQEVKKKRSNKWDQPPTAPPAPTLSLSQRLDGVKEKKQSRTPKNAIFEADADDGERKRPLTAAEREHAREEQLRKEKRAKRFDQRLGTATPPPPVEMFYDDVEGEPTAIVGRSTQLEKKYLRLTSAPDPATVRPLSVLRETLELLKRKWRSEQNYAYICDQFKSMRQDLTVQLIQNEFTVNVYEIHARIALERGDQGEYNQCQTQLRSLYAQKIAGHPEEFAAYRILYLLHTRNRSAMSELLIELTPRERADAAVRHALAVQRALEEADYHALAGLYASAPNMGGYIMDWFVERELEAAVATPLYLEWRMCAATPHLCRNRSAAAPLSSLLLLLLLLFFCPLPRFLHPPHALLRHAAMIKGLRRSLKGDKPKDPPTHHVSHLPSHHTPPHNSPHSGTPAAAMTPPKRVIRALYDYTAAAPGELSFRKGDFFHVVSHENDPDWFEAADPAANTRGMVPVAYFQVLGRTERQSVGSVTSVATSTASAAAASAAPTSPDDRRASDAASSVSSTSSGRKAYQPLYGVVQYPFDAERPDELQASGGDAVIIVAQSNHEWFVAKPIGRLGGPGLIPISFVEIRDISTGKPVDNVSDAIQRAGLPKVEEWKKRTAEYKASSIPLGKFDDDAIIPYSQFQQMALAHQAHVEQQHSAEEAAGPPPELQIDPESGPAIIGASVDKFSLDNGRYWYLLSAEMEDGTSRSLFRYYEDFYDFQIRLLNMFPDEAGRTGRTRTLPFIPGPVTYVNDSISSQRRANLDEYVRKLIALPPYIAQSALVKGLFALRYGDIDSAVDSVRSSAATGGARYSSAASSRMSQPAAGRYSASHAGGSGGNRESNLAVQIRASRSSGYSSSSDVRASYDPTMAPLVSPLSPRESASAATVEMDRVLSTATTATSATTSDAALTPSGSAGSRFLKVKIFYQDELVAVRLPVDTSYAQLENKVQERLGSTNLTFYFQDDSVQPPQQRRLSNDAELSAATKNATKMVLFAH